MSILDQIEAALRDRKIHELPMLVESDPVKRTMLLETQLLELLTGDWEDRRKARRVNRLRATLEEFVKGSRISMSFTPYKHEDAYMGLLDPIGDGIWEIRARDPRPAMRVFGRFALPDVFIAFGWAFRSRTPDWATDPPLGEANSDRFRLKKNECLNHWDDLFRGSDPVLGENINDYVTKYATDASTRE